MSRKLKCCAWNIGGQVHEISPFVAAVASDVYIFTETWLMQGAQHPHVRKYKAYASQRVRTSRCGRGHGGVVVYVKSELVASGVSVTVDADLGVVAVELKPWGAVLVGAYISPEGPRANPVHPEPFGGLQSFVAALQARSLQVMLLGDLNARIGTLADYDQQAIEVAVEQGVPGPHRHFAAVPRVRASQDKSVNSYGRDLLHMLTACSMVVLNGRAPGDTGGKLTCASTQGAAHGGSVVDLACVSVESYQRVQSFAVLPDVPEAQHRPISLCVSLPYLYSRQHDVGVRGVRRVRVLRPSPYESPQGLAYAQAMSSEGSLQFLSGLRDALVQGTVSATCATEQLVQHMRGVHAQC